MIPSKMFYFYVSRRNICIRTVYYSSFSFINLPSLKFTLDAKENSRSYREAHRVILKLSKALMNFRGILENLKKKNAAFEIKVVVKKE